MILKEAQLRDTRWEPPTVRLLGTFGSIMRGGSGVPPDTTIGGTGRKV